MHEKKRFYKKKWFWIFLIVVILVMGGIIVKSRGSKVPEFSTTKVEKVNLEQSVSETGSVEADLELDYGWEITGRVVEISKKIGDKVEKGDVVAMLDSTKQRARLNEASSGLAAARAKLNLELAGAENEEIRKAAAAVDQAKATVDQYTAQLSKVRAESGQDITDAENDLADAENDLQLAEGGEDSQIVQDSYDDLVNILKTAVNVLSDSLKEADDILGIDNPTINDDFESILAETKQERLSDAKRTYRAAKDKKDIAESETIFLDSTNHGVVDLTAVKVQDTVEATQENLYYVQLVLNATNSRIGKLTQTELSTLKSDISTALANANAESIKVTNGMQAVTSARNSLSSYQIAYDKAVIALNTTKTQSAADVTIAKAQLDTQKANLAQKEASYDALVADPREVDLASLRADVNRQGANVQALQDDVDKTQLIALADGVVSKIDIEVGENVTANQEVFGIISSQLSIEVDISESDIAKVEVGDPVVITLDAFGDDKTFGADVVSIEPAETEISGVIYYKTKILFEDREGNGVEGLDVRSGMTANVEIMTERRNNVLVIPQRAIIEKGGKKIVRVLTNLKNGLYDEVKVGIGLRGNDGQIEIISGLSEGQEIITFIKEN